MELAFTEFVGKAPRLEAIQVTAENVEALAVWMGADAYSVSKTLVGGERKVRFIAVKDRPGSPNHPYEDSIVFTKIGDWLVKFPEQILNENGRLYGSTERFISYTQKEIDEFVIQQRDNGEIDFSAAPYDR